MTSRPDLYWHLPLELKLRKTTGNAFQSFFSDLMEARYGEDFVRVKPYGPLGDQGCDGYLQSSGTVYACYGAQNGASGAVSAFIEKMHSDFDKAQQDLGDLMKSWQMTHNIVEGLPVQAIHAKNKLQEENPNIEFGFVGKPKITEIISDLTEKQRIALLGEYARNKDYFEIQISEVKELVDSLLDSIEHLPAGLVTIEPVSPKKMEINNIPVGWAQVLSTSRINAHHIRGYFDLHAIPTRGEDLAQIFRDKYAELRSQNLNANTILNELFELIAGPGSMPIDKQVAAHSLLSYLFERCDIFENESADDFIS